MLKIAAIALLLATATNANPLQETWGAEDCQMLQQALDFDPDGVDRADADYAEDLAQMMLAIGFLHGYAVANGWDKVPDFDYVADFKAACREQTRVAPLQLLNHLF